MTIGVSGGTTTFFSPSLYLTRMFWPSVPLHGLGHGGVGHGRIRALVPGPETFGRAALVFRENMHGDRLLGAVRLRHRGDADEEPSLISDSSVLATPNTATLSVMRTFMSVPSRDLIDSIEPSTASMVPRIRTVGGCCAHAAVRAAATKSVKRRAGVKTSACVPPKTFSDKTVSVADQAQTPEWSTYSIVLARPICYPAGTASHRRR